MSEMRHVQVLENILKVNDYLAEKLRKEWSSSRTFVVNLMSSPGSGKTTLLEAALPRLRERHRVLVLQGDLETERDAERIRALDIKALQITTGGTCHLEAHMIDQARQLLSEEKETEPTRGLADYDFVFIENVGNLVCPAGYDLGEHLRVVLISVPEGDDKVWKYPKVFRTSHELLISKSDLLPHCDFDQAKVIREALDLQPGLEVGVVSARSGEGVADWIEFLESKRDETFPS